MRILRIKKIRPARGYAGPRLTSQVNYRNFCKQDENFHKSGGSFNKCAQPEFIDLGWYSNYICDEDRLRLSEKYQSLANLKAKHAQLLCVYNTYLGYRTTIEGEPSINCPMPSSAPFLTATPTCIRADNKGDYENNGIRNYTYSHYVDQIGDEEAQLRAAITEIQKEIEYEKEQRLNLNRQREEKGITQRDLNILYPERKEVAEELAPDLADDIEDEEDSSDQWIIAGLSTAAVLGIAYILYRKYGVKA